MTNSHLYTVASASGVPSNQELSIPDPFPAKARAALAENATGTARQRPGDWILFDAQGRIIGTGYQ